MQSRPDFWKKACGRTIKMSAYVYEKATTNMIWQKESPLSNLNCVFQTSKT